MRRKVVFIILALSASLFLSTTICFADGYWVQKEVDICKNYVSNSAVFSHNKNGYWQCSNAYIYDNSINYTLGYGSCIGTVSFIYSLPSTVVSALKQGNVKVYLENPGGSSCVDYKKFSYSFNGLSSLSFNLSLFPRFAPGYTVNRYIKGISGTIPIVEAPYGRNLYRIYRFGSAYNVSGYFSSANPNTTAYGCLHPSQIIDSNGNILNSASLNLNGSIYKGNLCTVGNGDFKNRGSVYLEFDCPIVLRFTTTVWEYISTGESQGSSGSSNGNNSGGGSTESNEKEDPVSKPSFNKQIHRYK